jgi:glycosyltransferase involved in cell wall biosynthesis
MVYKPVAAQIFDKADRIVCVSEYEKRLVREKFRVNERKMTVIPNGVNLDEFTEFKKKKQTGNKVVLYVGRLERYKGVHTLVNALPKLSGDVRLEIVGEGPEKKTLMRLAREARVAERVIFRDNLPRKQLLRKYVDASVFVLLSEHEAYGISVGEALAAGTPCIVANNGALAEWIDDTNCYGIDRPTDVEALATMIDKVMVRHVGPVHLSTWNEAAQKLLALFEDARHPRDISV